jgi:hypothetical protein
MVLRSQSCICAGFVWIPLQWIKSYLKNRSQKVQIFNQFSQSEVLKYGVRQGSILGPILFLIYVNSLSSTSISGKLFLYADDTTLFCNAKSTPKLEIDTFIQLNTCSVLFQNESENQSSENQLDLLLKARDARKRPYCNGR